jgi:CRP/FNR family cyclic AMP-dependent transcriptional regulator
MVSPAAAEQFLAAPWLSDLDATARLALLNVLQEHHADAGTELLTQGKSNDRIIFQLRGETVATRTYPGRHEELVARLPSPTVYGEISFFRPTTCLATVRACTPVWYLSLDRHGHEALRRADPRTAEQFAVATLKIIADRFEMIDRRVTDFLAEHENHHPRASEWNTFRSRLFEESNI